MNKNRDIFTVLEERSKNLDNRHFKEYNTVSENKQKETVYQRNALAGIQTDNILNQTFFSKANMKIIQNGIRYHVHKKTNNIIGEQNETDLIIIMRAMYFQHCRNLPNNIAEQIEELNDKVIENVLPKLISNIKQYQDYLENKARIPEPISRSINVNNKGTKQLRSVTSTF
jgi:hypothetical protein